MPSHAHIHQLYGDDQPIESPGEEFKLTSYVRDLTRCGLARTLGPAMATLMNLAGRANKQCRCWPTVEMIAADLGCYKRRVIEDIEFLQERGAIAVADRPVAEGKRGKWQNEYVLMPVSNIIAKTPPSEIKKDQVRKSAPRAEKRALPSAENGEKRGAHIYMEVNKREVTNDGGAPTPPADVPSTRRSRKKDANLDRISTTHDPDASAERRLALDLCRILGWKTVGRETLARFEGYYIDRLALPFNERSYADAEARLEAFNGWLDSNDYWKRNAHMFSDAQMSKEWNAWVGGDEPASKPQRGKPQSSIGRAYRAANGGA